MAELAHLTNTIDQVSESCQMDTGFNKERDASRSRPVNSASLNRNVQQGGESQVIF